MFRYARQRAKLDRIQQQVEDGRILRAATTFPAERATDIDQLLAAGGVRGRPVPTFRVHLKLSHPVPANTGRQSTTQGGTVRHGTASRARQSGSPTAA
ncbi:hypothetical protein GCM10010304_39830 [Streptomyces roseoviolaceus]